MVLYQWSRTVLLLHGFPPIEESKQLETWVISVKVSGWQIRFEAKGPSESTDKAPFLSSRGAEGDEGSHQEFT